MNTRYYVDKAPTSRAHCWYCRETITKGTPRIYFNSEFKKNISKPPFVITIRTKRKLCYRCAPSVMQREIDTRHAETKEMINLRKKFIRMSKGKKASSAIQSDSILRNLQELKF